jgi:hypothetical protein
MKLTGIDAAKSKEGEIVFLTEPPMNKEVLHELANIWILGSEFDVDGGLLVWRGGAYPEKSLRQQTDIFLTEAEDAVKAKKPEKGKQRRESMGKVAEQTGVPKKRKDTKQHKEFLKKVAEQTGLPAI